MDLKKNNLQELKSVGAGLREAVIYANIFLPFTTHLQLHLLSLPLLDREAKKRHLTQTQRQGHKGSN